MKAAPYVLLIILAVALVIWLGWLAWHKFGALRKAHRQHVKDQDEAAARWDSYRRMDPDTGAWTVGIELRTPHGIVLYAPDAKSFPETTSEDALIEAHAAAANRAGAMNSYGRRP